MAKKSGKKKLRIGIIGTGGIARAHLNSYMRLKRRSRISRRLGYYKGKSSKVL